MAADRGATFRWQGAAHYHISQGGRKIVIDPLYTRLPGDKPHLEATRDDLDRADALLLTHGHLDHSWDFPYLVLKHAPEVHAPGACLRDVRKHAARSGSAFEMSKCHVLEEVKGKSFEVAGIEMTPYQIGAEEIDFWFIRSMFWRPWRHATPRAMPTGIRWLTHHLFGNCFCFHFRFPTEGKTVLYFGNLTDQVEELGDIERVDVLAIPYCPANREWLRQSQILIQRFRPDVTLVHHFDNFLNPFTLSKYMNLEAYRRALRQKCPDARLVFSKFDQEVRLAEIAGCGRIQP
jgi:L-ascorbate metabolism protein UlaG (beta-lactamase superfamily)